VATELEFFGQSLFFIDVEYTLSFFFVLSISLSVASAPTYTSSIYAALPYRLDDRALRPHIYFIPPQYVLVPGLKTIPSVGPVNHP
jgi:hypothetical protein